MAVDVRTAESIARAHGGSRAHCSHSAVTYCRRCSLPMHCVVDARSAFQFPSAASAVAFMRENGARAAAATRAAFEKKG
jgi:hypothetical protein